MLRLSFIIFSLGLLLACSDPCKDVNCNNGSCDEDSGNCICDDWYEGSACDIESRAIFLGTWNSSSACMLGSQNDSPNWSFETAALINTFILHSPDVLNDVIITATLVSANQATITPFEVGGSSFTGSISYINETTMSMVIDLDGATQSFTCNYTMSR